MTEHPHSTDGLTRYVLVLLAMALTCTTLYFGRDLLILLFTSGLFSFLLLPLCQKLERWHFPGWLAASVCSLLLVAVLVGMVWFIGWQYGAFGADLPALTSGLNEKFGALREYVDQRFHVDEAHQRAWTRKQLNGLAEQGGSIVLGLFSTTGTVLAVVVPIPIFLFLLLMLRGKFRTFFAQLSADNSDTVLNIVVNCAELSRRYLKGVLTVMLILSVLNSIGFLILGLKYAILLGVTAAMLNVVPYVGPWVGSILPILIALITKDSAMYALGALGVILISQFIDNNFITPKVVGSSVSINPLASIVALFAGGMLWGVVGLVLAIPITGMLKIVCDEVPSLKPYGFLLGEERRWPEEDLVDIPLIRTRPSKRKKPK